MLELVSVLESESESESVSELMKRVTQSNSRWYRR